MLREESSGQNEVMVDLMVKAADKIDELRKTLAFIPVNIVIRAKEEAGFGSVIQAADLEGMRKAVTAIPLRCSRCGGMDLGQPKWIGEICREWEGDGQCGGTIQAVPSIPVPTSILAAVGEALRESISLFGALHNHIPTPPEDEENENSLYARWESLCVASGDEELGPLSAAHESLKPYLPEKK